MEAITLSIKISAAMYAALERAVEADKIQRPDPTNPKRQVIEPRLGSVADLVAERLGAALQPYFRADDDPEAQVLQTEITERQQRLDAKRRPTVTVTAGYLWGLASPASPGFLLRHAQRSSVGGHCMRSRRIFHAATALG